MVREMKLAHYLRNAYSLMLALLHRRLRGLRDLGASVSDDVAVPGFVGTWTRPVCVALSSPVLDYTDRGFVPGSRHAAEI